MPIVPIDESNLSIRIKKKLATSTALAEHLLGVTITGTPVDIYGIYQDRTNQRGIPIVRMKSYRPTNPQTVPQQANRSKFADAMTSWQSLTSEQKAVYNKRGKRLHMTGHNLYIKEYMLA